MSQYGTPQQPPPQAVYYAAPPKSPGTAALLEILIGLFAQTFGIGHIYAGHVGRGIFIMLSYWCLQIINVILMMVLIGFITYPITW